MTDRIDNLDENSLIEEFKKLRQDIDQIKTDQLIRLNKFNIALTGTVSIDATSSTAGVPLIAQITHGLGYIPAPLVFASFGGGTTYIPLPHFMSISITGGKVTFDSWSWAAVDRTTLYINFYPGGSGNNGIQSYRYYLLRESAN